MLWRLAVFVITVTLAVVTVEVTRAGPGFSFAQATAAGETFLLLGGVPLGLAALLVRRRAVSVLLVATASVWFFGEWDNPAANRWVFTLGLVLLAVGPAVAVHLAVVNARLWRSLSLRVVVLAGYATTFGLVGLASSLVYDPVTLGCVECPDNLLAVGHDPELWFDVSALGVWVGTAWVMVAIMLLGWSLLRAGRVRRRESGAVTVCVLAYLVLELAHCVRSLRAGLLGSDAGDRGLWQYQSIAFACLGVAVVAELVRAARSYRALTRLVSGFSTGIDQDVRAGLAARLGDPSAFLGYPTEGGSRLVDEEGTPVSVPTGRAVTEVRRGGSVLAYVVHRPDVAADRIRDLASAVYLALDHQRLRAEALAQLADIRRSGERIVTAGDAERRRLEQDLHDGAQQSLVALLLAVRTMRARVDSPQLAGVEQSFESAVEQLRALAHGLYPLLLDRAGLGTALAALAETRALTIATVPDHRLPLLIESTAYLVVEWAGRGGPSIATVTVEDDVLKVTVEVHGEPGDLAGIADRVTTLDGQFSAECDGGCTLVITSLPIGG